MERKNTTINYKDKLKIRKEYKKMLDEYWIKNDIYKYDKKIKKTIKETNKNSEWGSKYGKVNFIIDYDPNDENFTNSVYAVSADPKGGAFVFSKGDILFFLAHGTNKGNIFFQDEFYKPSEIINKLEKQLMIPENVNKIYTLNCFGGLQEPFVTPGGIKVQSAHNSKKPIANINLFDKRFFSRPTPTFYFQDKADITDELKQDLLKFKNENFKGLYGTYHIQKALYEDEVNEITKQLEHIKQQREKINNIINHDFFNFLEITHKAISNNNNPVHINPTNKNVPENTGGTAEFSFFFKTFFSITNQIIPAPANKNPID